MKLYLFSILGTGLIWAISKTLRLKVIGQEKVEELTQQKKRIVYVFWHGRQFALVFYMRQRGIALLSSLSRDGEYQARILSNFGYRVVRGSTSRGGVKGLLGLAKEMRQGYDVTFAVDGPRGPAGEVKEGAVYLAKKMKAYLVPVSCGVKKGWIFTKAWDKYLLPKPFTKGVIIFGQPYLPTSEISEECHHLKQRLNILTEQADKLSKEGEADGF